MKVMWGDEVMWGSEKTSRRAQLARLGVLAQVGLVAGAVIVVWLTVAPLAYALSGSAGMIASAVAAGACLLGAEFALIATLPFARSSAVLYSLGVGMLGRTLIPLLFGAVLHAKVPYLAGAGMIFYLLVFYMVVLATETALTLAKVPPSTASSGKAV